MHGTLAGKGKAKIAAEPPPAREPPAEVQDLPACAVQEPVLRSSIASRCFNFDRAENQQVWLASTDGPRASTHSPQRTQLMYKLCCTCSKAMQRLLRWGCYMLRLDDS
eukprot:2602435-Amphidinium_carterae.1